MIDARIVASILTDTYCEVDKIFQIDIENEGELDDSSPVTGAARVAWGDAKPGVYHCWSPKLEVGDIVYSDFVSLRFYVAAQWLDSSEIRTEKMYLSELHSFWRIMDREIIMIASILKDNVHTIFDEGVFMAHNMTEQYGNPAMEELNRGHGRRLYCWTHKLEPNSIIIIGENDDLQHYIVIEQWFDDKDESDLTDYLSHIELIWRIWIT